MLLMQCRKALKPYWIPSVHGRTIWKELCWTTYRTAKRNNKGHSWILTPENRWIWRETYYSRYAVNRRRYTCILLLFKYNIRMKQLTKSQVFNIYSMIFSWFSQRCVAKRLWHNRRTIAKYLEPKVITKNYIVLYFEKYALWVSNKILTNEKSLWKSLAIIGAIGHVLVLLSYFFI